MKVLIIKQFILMFVILGSTLSAEAYEIFRTGNLTDLPRPTQAMTCLAGGGSDDLWAEGWRRSITLLKFY